MGTTSLADLANETQPAARARAGMDGDLLVLQRRGWAGKSQGVKDTMRTLRLGKPRQHTIGFREEPGFRGQVRKLRGIVEEFPLALCHTQALSSADSDPNQPGVVPMTAESFQVQHRPARICRLDNGEYIQAETHDGYFSMSWSSALPLKTVLDRTLPLIGEPAEGNRGVLVLSAAGEPVYGEAAELLGSARQCPDEVKLLRLEFEDFTFVWRASFGRKQGNDIALDESGVLCAYYDERFCRLLVRRTGTEEVAGTASYFLAQFDEILTSVKEGDLVATGFLGDPE